ncbi:MAG TPA: hypothetical protein VFJ16_29520 [Longimicrobium sp.]|nr:hypothetical protein [Longimicrobium sp.]
MRNPMRPLSLDGTREVLEEMSRPPEDTPARRRMMQRVREMAALRERLEAEDAAGKKAVP